jgi:hypothetical protein
LVGFVCGLGVNCTHNPKVGGSNPPPATNSINHLAGFTDFNLGQIRRFLPELDPDIFGECQAMLINFETMLSEEFGAKQAVGADFPFALQFSRITQPEQQRAMRTATRAQLKSVREFVEKFRSSLSDNVSSDQAYSYKVFLIPKVGTHASYTASGRCRPPPKTAASTFDFGHGVFVGGRVYENNSVRQERACHRLYRG